MVSIDDFIDWMNKELDKPTATMKDVVDTQGAVRLLQRFNKHLQEENERLTIQSHDRWLARTVKENLGNTNLIQPIPPQS